MGQALYRKYRSKSLNDIVGQEHITKTLDQAIKTNRVSHAYLFTGPRGVGKTSIARILAHDINGLPYEDDSQHIDIIEIDAASNRRIDEIRELREKVYIAPTSAKYKVYIIDEVHMLTKEAFNALLKTLEEPPEHVVFILATTDAHKLPETIISRTQRFQFKPIDANSVIAHLKQIAKSENITIDEEALGIIAEHGQGSFRDSIGLLDQAANFASPVTADTLNSLLGMPPQALIDQLITHLSSGNRRSLITTLNALFAQGYPAAIVASRLSANLRQSLIENQTPIAMPQLLSLLESLIDVPASGSPEHFLEISVLKALPGSVLEQLETQPITTETTTPKETPVEKPLKKEVKQPETKSLDVESVKAVKPPKANKTAEKPVGNSSLNDESWEQVLNHLKSKYNTLYGIVRMAKLDASQPGVVKLQFAFAFHQKRINDAKNKDIILTTIEQVTGVPYALECIVDQSLLSKPKPATVPEEPDLSAISNIFGGGEMIEE